MSEWGAKSERVREHLLGLLESRAIGEKLPPERQLAKDLEVARSTVRTVVDDLVREGRLSRRQGSGTFVSDDKFSYPLTMISFSEDMVQRGLSPSSRTLRWESLEADARLARRLEISPGDRLARVARLRLADGRPMAIETLHLPGHIAHGISAEDLERFSFYELLQEKLNVRIGFGQQEIEPTVTTAEESRHLEVPLHSPAFLFERVTRDDQDTVFEYVRSVYRGDRYKLTTRLTPSRTR